MFRKIVTAYAAATLTASVAAAQTFDYVNNTAPAQQAAPMPAQPVAVQQAQGRIFTYPVPQGWRLVNETTNEILIAAPDSTQAIGFTGLERMQVGNSAQFLQRVAQMYGSQNLQILSGNRLPVPNCDAIEAIITYTSGGKPCKAWVRVAVVAQNGFGNGYMLMAIATPEKFDSVVAELKPLCDRIQITDASAAFDRANAAAAARPVYTSSAPSLNHPMDDTVTSGYWDRQKTMDNISARRSDVTLDSYRSTDPSTGQVYYHGQDAYDPTRGGVVNPERPTEILTPEQQWQGR